MNNKKDNELLEQHLKSRTEEKFLELNHLRLERFALQLAERRNEVFDRMLQERLRIQRRNDVLNNSFEVHKLLSDPKKLIDFLASNTTNHDLKIKLGVIFNIDSLFILRAILSEGIISSTGSNISEERIEFIVKMIQNQNPTLKLHTFRNVHGKNIFDIASIDTQLTVKEARDLAILRAQDIQDDELEQSIKGIISSTNSSYRFNIGESIKLQNLMVSFIFPPSNIEDVVDILRAKSIFDWHSSHNKENASYEIVHQAIELVFSENSIFSHHTLHRASIVHSLILLTARISDISSENKFMDALGNLGSDDFDDSNALHRLAWLVPQNNAQCTIYKLVVNKLIDNFQLNINTNALHTVYRIDSLDAVDNTIRIPYNSPIYRIINSDKCNLRNTPINLSVFKHNHVMLSILLSRGADISGNNFYTNLTTLHLAALLKNTEAIKVLCEAGVDIKLHTFAGTPLQIYMRDNANPDQATKAILEKYEATMRRKGNYYSINSIDSAVYSAFTFGCGLRLVIREFTRVDTDNVKMLYVLALVLFGGVGTLDSLGRASDLSHDARQYDNSYFEISDLIPHILSPFLNIRSNAIQVVQNANELVEQSIVEGGMCNIL